MAATTRPRRTLDTSLAHGIAKRDLRLLSAAVTVAARHSRHLMKQWQGPGAPRWSVLPKAVAQFTGRLADVHLGHSTDTTRPNIFAAAWLLPHSHDSTTLQLNGMGMMALKGHPRVFVFQPPIARISLHAIARAYQRVHGDDWAALRTALSRSAVVLPSVQFHAKRHRWQQFAVPFAGDHALVGDFDPDGVPHIRTCLAQPEGRHQAFLTHLGRHVLGATCKSRYWKASIRHAAQLEDRQTTIWRSQISNALATAPDAGFKEPYHPGRDRDAAAWSSQSAAPPRSCRDRVAKAHCFS